jgi:membrane dipeptidase
MQFETRRRFLKTAGALALALGHPRILRAAGDLPIADAHSHIGMFSSKLSTRSLKVQMQESGVTLLSWNIVGDSRWIVRTNNGMEQRSVPANGEQANYLRQKLDAMREYLAKNDLDYVRNPADIDAARSGAPHVVIAVEGAGFTADSLELLEQSYANGLRHLQLVHYIRNALGDFQTERPEHNGMTELGVNVVKSCNRLGILVDLAHATNPVIDKALEVSATPIIWSHSAITTSQYAWQQSSNLSRRLYIDYARKIAQRGGAVGLWSLQNTVGSSPAGYANELMRMVDAIGPEHVMFGTDLDGVGKYGVMDQLGDLRKVADLLRERGVDDKTLRAICFDNYARCLRAAMEARQA